MNLKSAIREAASEREKQESQYAVNAANNKYADIASSEAVKPEEPVEFAALTIRVPKKSRVHWLISAKKENTSLTAAITEALNARFGEAE